MTHPHLLVTQTFDEHALPDLDVVVLAALERFMRDGAPPLPHIPYRRPLVVGSSNARATGEVLFRETDAIYADEADVAAVLATRKDIDGAVLISASGGKHAVAIAQLLSQHSLETHLFTTTATARAAAYLHPKRVHVFPKNREPYTYNTSTYLGMILAATGESAEALHTHVTSNVLPLSAKLRTAHRAYTLLVPEAFSLIRPFLRTKFDELFGPKITGRVFTHQEAKHAKTVVQDEQEQFISLGVPNEHFGVAAQRLTVPLPEKPGFGALFAVGYAVVGLIQKAHPPYFKEHIGRYVAVASELFGHPITTIVE